jgi:hypothetical protein
MFYSIQLSFSAFADEPKSLSILVIQSLARSLVQRYQSDKNPVAGVRSELAQIQTYPFFVELGIQSLELLKSQNAIRQKDYFWIASDGKVYHRPESLKPSLGSQPVLVEGPWGTRKVTAISGEYSHIVAQTEDGKMYSWGNGKFWQLGFLKDPAVWEMYKNNWREWDALDSDNHHVDTPTRIEGPWGNKKIRSIRAGSFHTFVIAEDGTLYGWGSNYFGNLGVNKRGIAYSPEQIQGSLQGKKVTWVETNYYNSIAITEDGKLHLWGSYSNQNDGMDMSRNLLAPHLIEGELKDRIVKWALLQSRKVWVLTEHERVFTIDLTWNRDQKQSSLEPVLTEVSYEDFLNQWISQNQHRLFIE